MMVEGELSQQGWAESQKNKVIRPKSRASALSKKGDRQTNNFCFKKTFEMAVYSSKLLLYHSET